MASNLGISVKECRGMLDKFFEMYPTVKKFTVQNEEDAKNIGFVEDYIGRRRHLPDASLDQLVVTAMKDLYTNADCFIDCSPSDSKISVVDEERTKELQKEWKDFENSNINIGLKEKKKKFKKKYSDKDFNVVIKDNGNFISRALCQCTNARIQGSAATLTKKAMVKIFNDGRMKELGFRILVPVHDELLGECPIENAEEAEKRLAQLMIEAAKPECSVAMKVDTYRVKHWYADEASNKIRQKYLDKVSSGLSDEYAIGVVSREFPEISFDVLNDMCHGTYDVLSNNI